MEVYYAHMRCLYGTPEEKLQKAQIERAFPGARIVDPSLLQNSSEMGYFLKLAKRCDAVVFSKVDGKIGSGVGKEVNCLISEGKPAFELLGDGSVVKVTEQVSHLNVDETVVLLKRHGVELTKEELDAIERLPPSERFSHGKA